MTDGSAGMVNQCLGVAETLAVSMPNSKFSIEEKIISLRAPWKWGAPFFRQATGFALAKKSNRLDPPYPDLLISCGRQAIVPALHVKKISGGKTAVVHIQNPVINPGHFDALIVPQHDHIIAPNVIQTLGAPHRISLERLAAERSKFLQFQKKTPNEKIMGVLVGGACKAYPMDQQSAQNLVDSLLILIQQGYRLLISPSRRTPLFVIDMLKCQLVSGAQDQVYFWDMGGENPYFSILANSDALLVTCDSVCMITEACVTDKPVYLFPLKGGNRKFNTFHDALLARGRIQWFPSQEASMSLIQLGSVQSFNEMKAIVVGLQKILPSLFLTK